ncbi:putative methyltransferase-domain-containing protein [Apiosordaria backusii]|uniref:Protein-lysine N-methyltransferase EFM6 n=1 Tax=Apiosordaria backusii TaxID=314023 RepID=A0AA40ETS0_9PEZI|nr:putative methyltransferase-domain-containing protein [Apiosordaria backusii]
MDDRSRPSSPEISPLDFGEDLAPLPVYKAAATTALDFSGLLDEPLKLHEDLSSGCGGQLWPAGMVLAKHMLHYQRDKLQTSRVLELGAGGGIVGLTIAKGCRIDQPLYITDMIDMEPLMQHNIALNELGDRVRGRILNWGEPLSQEIIDFKPDTILAADCVYFEPAFPLLLQTLKDLLTLTPTATVFFCFKKRRRADMQFLKSARRAFRVTELEDGDRPVFAREGLFLYAITAK